MTTTATQYRYHLPKKAIKGDCPQCSPRHRRTLSRFIDAQTGKVLPEEFGRCDRESNCGYFLSPYQKTAPGLSYADEQKQPILPEAWFRLAGRLKRQGNDQASVITTLIQTEGATQEQAERVIKYVFSRPALSTQPTQPIPICSIPDEVFTKSLGHYEKNQFAILLERQFGATVAYELLQRFQIGTSSHWPGACVFWLIDEQGRKRGGQIKLFGDDWHTIKYVDTEGRKRSKTSWVHYALSRRLDKQNLPYPGWLTAYIGQGECSPCLFGLPQLKGIPIDHPIAIVEAPKTAVICSALIPDFIWLASVGLSYLKAERLAPLRGRPVILYPDLSTDGKTFSRWRKVAEELNEKGYQIRVSDYLESRATDDQKRNGLDLADFLLPATSRHTELPPLIVSTVAEQRANPGSILKPDESRIDRYTVEPCNDYPVEWDKASEEPAGRWAMLKNATADQKANLDMLVDVLDLELVSIRPL